jgi:hypothetical protein
MQQVRHGSGRPVKALLARLARREREAVAAAPLRLHGKLERFSMISVFVSTARLWQIIYKK